MKKIFGFMVFAGVILAMTTAGGFDSGIISISRILTQSVISIALIYTGSTMLGRSHEA
ncbi:MAG: hypothetical protein IJC69_06640 [Clostridia bacterium]|nr:hypothetical protein [Clostridia bacterium]